MKFFITLLAIFSSSVFASGLGTTVCHEISAAENKATYLITEKEEGFIFEEQLNHKTLEKVELSREDVTFDNRSGIFFTFLNQKSSCSESLSITLMTNDDFQGDIGVQSSRKSKSSRVKCQFFPLDDDWAEEN